MSEQTQTSQSPMRDLAARVKINPETYLKFQGNDKVILRNVFGEKAMEFKYDIMLLLYDMLDWKVIGDLLAPWPPEDQAKILNYLEMFYESKIVISDEAQAEELPESGLHQDMGREIHINSENHHNMLKDHVRMTAYRRAIEQTVTPDTIAMDLGAGSGVLSMFAAKSGAKKVYAIEKQPHIVLLAQEIARVNQCPQIEFFEGASSQLGADLFTPKPTLLISEIIGNAILEEKVLEFTLDARDRFLAPGGKLLPWKLDICIFAFRSDVRPDIRQEVNAYNELYGLNFGLLGEVICNKTTMTLDRYQPMVNKTMTDPVVAKSLNLYTLITPFFRDDFELVSLSDGEITGFCGFFKAYLDEETLLTNSPWAPQTHWTQIVFKLPEPLHVTQGETIPMQIVYDGALRVFPKASGWE